MALKWGIATAGLISHDFVVALEGLPKGSHEVIAVAASNLQKAQKFAKDHGIPKAYEGYEKLGKDQNVEVVYVGIINPEHYEMVLMYLEAGKHVLCEKPFAMNEKQAKKMIELARKKKLFLMEAVWSRCFPVYKELRKCIDRGDIGEVIQVNVDFGEAMMDVERIRKKALGGGALLDIGIYALQLPQFVFKGLRPTKMISSGFLNEDGVDCSSATIINYPPNKTAVVSSSGLVLLSCEAVICGTKGIIRIPEYFWCPTKMVVNGVEKVFPLPENNGKFNYTNSPGLAYEADEVKRCIREGKIESEAMSHEDTLELARLVDKVKADIGLVFPADLESYD